MWRVHLLKQNQHSEMRESKAIKSNADQIDLRAKSALEFSHCYFLTQLLTKHDLNTKHLLQFYGPHSLKCFFFSQSWGVKNHFSQTTLSPLSCASHKYATLPLIDIIWRAYSPTGNFFVHYDGYSNQKNSAFSSILKSKHLSGGGGGKFTFDGVCKQKVKALHLEYSSLNIVLYAYVYMTELLFKT